MDENKLKKINHILAVVIILPSLLIFVGNEVLHYWNWHNNCHHFGCPNEIYTFGAETQLLFLSLILIEIMLIMASIRPEIFEENKEK